MKINKLFMFALGCVAFASCSDDDYTPAVHGLTVTSAETTIEAAGATKTITTAESKVTAYAKDSWLAVSVDGGNVNVTAPQNNSAQSRNTTVVIKATAEDSAIVNVSQYGAVFQLSAGSSIILPSDAASKNSFFMKYNVPVTLSSSVDWINVSSTSDSLTVDVAENETGHMRVGYVYYQYGDSKDSISVKQYDFNKDIAGIYYWSYTTSKGTDGTLLAVLTSDSLEITDLDGLDIMAPISFNAQTATVSIQSGSYWGTYGNYYLYNRFLDASSNYWTSYSTSYYGELPFNYDEENGTYAALGGSFGSYQIAEMDMEACSSQTFSSSSYLGTLLSFINPVMVKANLSAAKQIKKLPQMKPTSRILRK